MPRRLKLDIPGPDWRILPEELAEKGLPAMFGAVPSPPLPEVSRGGGPLRLVVDVGFGRGEFLTALAQAEPGTAFLGIEYSWKRVLKLVRRLARSELRNVRVVFAPAELVLPRLPDASVHELWINCPDPWPKKRHHRRRLIQPGFVREVARCLEPRGRLLVATDHPGYAEWIHGVLSSEPALDNEFAPSPWRNAAEGRVPTAYELEWRAEGRDIHYFAYRRRSGTGVGRLDP
jgi:tRNA (guanine-N7-)-methyltransferase